MVPWFVGMAAADDGPTALALDQAEAAALGERMPAVVESGAGVDAAHAAVAIARALPDPTVSVGATRYSARSTAGAEWTLPLLGPSAPGIHAAREDERAAVARAGQDQLRIRADVDLAWSALWASEARARLAQASTHQARSLRDAAQARLDAGDAPRIDALAAEAALSRAEADLAGAEATRRGDAAVLASLVGETGDLATDGAPSTAAADSLDDLQAALAAHPDAVAAGHDLEAALARTRAARLAWLPLLTVGVEADVGDPGLPGTDLLGTAAMTLPLGGVHGPEVAASRAESVRVEAGAARGAAAREAALVRAWYALDGALARLAALDGRAVPAAEESAALAREAYDVGEIDITGLLAAQGALNAIRADRIDAVLDVARTRVELLLASGGAGE